MQLVEIANLLVPLVPAPAADRALRKLIAELAAEIAAPAVTIRPPTNSAPVSNGEIVLAEQAVAEGITANGYDACRSASRAAQRG